MIYNAEIYIDKFLEVESDIITIHIEAVKYPIRCLRKIRSYGKKAAIAINPTTDITNLKYIVDELDMILVMTVEPGFAGQKAIPSAVAKIREIHSLIERHGKSIDIIVDGQADENTREEFINNGANVLVLGASLFKYGQDAYSRIIKGYHDLCI